MSCSCPALNSYLGAISGRASVIVTFADSYEAVLNLSQLASPRSQVKSGQNGAPSASAASRVSGSVGSSSGRGWSSPGRGRGCAE